ncbi:hypothetical protein H0H87_003157 [Tephrocybe sp. NHM501043]|nr:hypothetical protein H0H87_003157 [Tephrocybe sp. NHM501043]
MLVNDSVNARNAAKGKITDRVMINLNISSFALSLATNLAATGLIADILWNNLKSLRDLRMHRKHFKAWRILLVLLESGAIYAAFQLVFNLLFSLADTEREANYIAIRTFLTTYTVVSLAYPVLTIAIVNGPFSMDRLQQSVVEIQTISEVPPSA